MDQAGFSLAKTHRGGGNVIGQTADVPVQTQTSIMHHCLIMLCNLVAPAVQRGSFLSRWPAQSLAEEETSQGGTNFTSFIALWGSMTFHPSYCSAGLLNKDARTIVVSILPLSSPYKGVSLCMQVEGLWPPSTWPDMTFLLLKTARDGLNISKMPHKRRHKM